MKTHRAKEEVVAQTLRRHPYLLRPHWARGLAGCEDSRIGPWGVKAFSLSGSVAERRCSIRTEARPGRDGMHDGLMVHPDTGPPSPASSRRHIQLVHMLSGHGALDRVGPRHGWLAGPLDQVCVAGPEFAHPGQFVAYHGKCVADPGVADPVKCVVDPGKCLLPALNLPTLESLLPTVGSALLALLLLNLGSVLPALGLPNLGSALPALLLRNLGSALPALGLPGFHGTTRTLSPLTVPTVWRYGTARYGRRYSA
eukprot:358439-Chlamydomonas_euryale.AAC.12